VVVVALVAASGRLLPLLLLLPLLEAAAML
jgi:hypothetical protein